MGLVPQVKTVLHPYTRIAWTNPATSELQSEIFDCLESEAAEELEDRLCLANIPYEKDILQPQ